MKTNKNCSMYNTVAPTDLDLAQAELSQDVVKVEGTKVLLNKAVVTHSLLLKFPKLRKRRKGPQDEDLEYLESRKSVQRRKTNPEVPFSDHLEKILQTLSTLPEVCNCVTSCILIVSLCSSSHSISGNLSTQRLYQTIIMSSNSPWTFRP